MTEFILKLRDDSKAGLLLATLGRLASQGLELAVERNGKGIALDTHADDAAFEATIQQIVDDAMAGNLAPLTPEEEREDDEYWATVGEELQLSDDEIVRLVKEVRAETHVRAAA